MPPLFPNAVPDTPNKIGLYSLALPFSYFGFASPPAPEPPSSSPLLLPEPPPPSALTNKVLPDLNCVSLPFPPGAALLGHIPPIPIFIL